MILRYYTSILILIAFSACSSQKKVAAPADWKGKSIQFVSGGGFTGISNYYTLLENGQVFLRSGVTTGAEQSLPDLDKKTVKSLFNRAAKLNWPAEPESHPGNMYYAVKFVDGTHTYSVLWGDGKYKPDTGITDLYKELNTLISPEKK